MIEASCLVGFLDEIKNEIKDRRLLEDGSEDDLMFKEIKGIILDYYDLIERLRNINFPIEAKRKK